MPHSNQKVTAYVRALKRSGAPQSVIDDFKEIICIDDGIEEEGRQLESLDRLLLDVCRRHGFAKVFDKPGARAWLRPSTIEDSHPDSHEDTAWGMSDSRFNPVVEQAYRRGYDHGLYAARLLIEKEGRAALQKRQIEISNWRKAPIFFGASYPGVVEPWGVEVAVRSSLPARRRFDVLERDRRRCVVCGRSAADGITLHVDHVVAVANGGSNELSNLQTLCEECNLGKGAR